MYAELDLLRKSKIVKDMDTVTFIDEEDIKVFYVKAILADNSSFFVRELATTDESKYSYHWQTQI